MPAHQRRKVVWGIPCRNISTLRAHAVRLAGLEHKTEQQGVSVARETSRCARRWRLERGVSDRSIMRNQDHELETHLPGRHEEWLAGIQLASDWGGLEARAHMRVYSDSLGPAFTEPALRADRKAL